MSDLKVLKKINVTKKKENPKTLSTEVTWKYYIEYSIEYIKIKLLNKNNKFKNNNNCQVIKRGSDCAVGKA